MTATNDTQRLDEIRKAGRARDYKKAITLCTRLLSETEEYPETLLYLGRSYHELGLYDKALRAFLFFRSRKPDSPLGNFFLGRTYAALGLHEQAIEPLRQALEKNPGFAPALSFLGVAHLKLRRPQEAVGYFEQALKADPGNERIHTAYLNALLVQAIRLFYRKELEQAARVFEFLSGERTDDIIPVVYLASIAREFGNVELALHYYDLALKMSPEDPVFHLHKAHLLMRSGRNREGQVELGRAGKIMQEDLPGTSDPDSLIKLISVTHFRNKRFREAIYFGKKVLKKNYRDPEMHMLLAECYRSFGEYEKAKNHYRRALENAPHNGEIAYGLAIVLWETGTFRELLTLTGRLERIRSRDPMAAYFRVLCRSELGESAETLIPLLQEQIHVHGPDPHLMWNLGRCYARLDRDDLAESWLLRTLKLVPDHRKVLLLLDRIYDRLGRIDDEIGLLKTILGHFPDETKFLYKYARLLLARRRYPEAAAVLEKLITIRPADLALKKTLGLVHIRAKNYTDALVIFKELILKDSRSVFYLRQFIYCVVRLKNLPTAALILEKAVRFIKDDPALLLPLGVIHGRLRHYEKSAEIFRSVISLRPKDWRAYRNLGMLYRRTGEKTLAAKFLARSQEYRETQGVPPKRANPVRKPRKNA